MIYRKLSKTASLPVTCHQSVIGELDVDSHLGQAHGQRQSTLRFNRWRFNLIRANVLYQRPRSSFKNGSWPSILLTISHARAYEGSLPELSIVIISLSCCSRPSLRQICFMTENRRR